MKLNIFTKSMIGMGLECSALPALAMEAWNNQQGGNKYQVIFDGKIYENAWWVSSTNCPGKAKANDATNPWRLKRTATAAEIREGANKRENSSRLTQSFHFFMFEPIFSPVNALNQPI